MKNNFLFIIILVLIILLLLQRGCNKPSTPIEVIKTEIIYDTITKEVPIYVPKWHTKIESKTDTFMVIDTVTLIGDYYATYVYQDSLINDSLKFYINDSITQNKIKSRTLNYSLIYPTTIITQVEQTRHLYGGLSTILGGEQIATGPHLLYTTKNNRAYGLGIKFNQELKPIVGVDLYWKIK